MTTLLPSVAVLEMTYRCNHACRFCSCPWFAGMLKPGPEMEVDEWKRLIEAYASAGVTQFSFTGGEALLKEGCLELMDFASKRAQAGLLSNGRAMTEDVLRFCAERGIHVMMSMPGLTSFAANTDSDTSVEHILSMFGRAHELGCATTVGIAVTKLNLPELYETISAALVAGADSLLLNRFLPGGRGLSHPELMLTAEEVRQIADVAEEVLSRAKRHGHFGTGHDRLFGGDGLLHRRAERDAARLQPQSGRAREVERVGETPGMRGVDALRAARLSAEDVRRLRQGREVPWRLPRGRARVQWLANRPRPVDGRVGGSSPWAAIFGIIWASYEYCTRWRPVGR